MKTEVLRVTIAELCTRTGCSQRLLIELVACEVARPVAGRGAEDWEFDATGARWLQTAARLTRDLELDADTTALVVSLLRERDSLTAELDALRRRLARFLAADE